MTKKKTAKTDEPKKTLLELVLESPIRYASIIMNLSREGLLGQLEEEKEKHSYGLPIKPSMTQSEFDKIMEE